MGAYHSTKKIRNFQNGDHLYGKSLGKVPENAEIVEFPKSEPFNRKFQRFRGKSQMERKFPGKTFRKFVHTSRGCPLFRNLCKFPIFHSALASSFGHLMQGWRASDKRNTLEPFHLYVGKY